MLIDSKNQSLQVRVAIGLSSKAKEFRLQLGEGVTGWVAKHGKSRIVKNANQEKDYIAVKQSLISELAVPMIIENKIVGVLSVDSQKENSFNGKQESFLNIMANLAARIFCNLQDYRLLKAQDRFHRVLLKISQVVSRSLSLKDIFYEMMKITEQTFLLHRSTLLLYDRDKDVLYIKAASHLSEKELKNISYAPGEGISGQVFLTKKSVFVPSVKQDPDFLNRMKVKIDTNDLGFFCTPIFLRDNVVGIFSTFTSPQNEYEPHFVLEFLEILGSTLSQAITIQNLIQDETRGVRFENTQLKQELSVRYQFGSLIARSASMRQLFETAKIIANSRASVLITGESGTGKELVACAIHYNSPRQEQSFIKINCAAIPENLIESELFGHCKGAFTGAIANKKGKFEIADGGTIFLDEIGELSLNLQSKLLRVLQEREIEPVGGYVRSVDIRVLTATNADLEEKIKRREFREDLYYRLNVIQLHIPPLRERIEDILPLACHFVEEYAAENHKQISSITPEAIGLLEQYHWPGNVRQLSNSIERAVVLSQKEMLDIHDFSNIQKK